MTPVEDRPTSRRYAVALWLLTALFCARVLGQMLVVFAHVTSLPPVSEWYSGLLRYRYLLPAQFAIIALLSKVCLHFWRGRGYFVETRATFARFALPFGWLYLSSMIVRYVIRMWLHPDARWFGQTIPIIFHCVLATYVLVFATYHRRALAAPPARLALSLAVVALGALGSSGCDALVARSILPRDARPGEFDVTFARLSMTTKEGVSLVSEVFRPRGPAKTPTILVRIPFARSWKNDAATNVIGEYWARRGYTVVLQGSRGRFRSSGEYYPLRAEREDGVETLAWLRQQPWFDGRLGMWGASGFAYTQWVLVDQLAPDSAALILQLCSSRIYDMFYAGGAFSLESALYWALRDWGNRDSIPSAAEIDRGAHGFPLLNADDRAGNGQRVFDDWASHPDRDDYWRRIDGNDRAALLNAPALLMAGWYDPFLPAQLQDYATIRSRPGRAGSAVRLVVGPWSHARDPHLPNAPELPPFRRESIAPALGWFDRHLLGRAVDGDDGPVRLYVMGENVWRNESEWPLHRAQTRSYYLRSGGHANTTLGDGRLDPQAPVGQEPADGFEYDPRDPVPSAGGAMIGPRAGVLRQDAVERRRDVLVYDGEPLASDLEVTGPISLVLHVATTAASTDFTGKLVDVHPDGSAYNISDGIVRRNYERNGDASSAPTEIRIELWPTSMLFKRGHRLRLEVSSSNFPRFDRNPNTGRRIATETAPIAATQTVFHGAGAPSRLLLPVVPRG